MIRSLMFSGRSERRIDAMKKLLDTNNRTKVVNQAISVAYMVMKAVKDGKKVMFETKDGWRETIRFPGIE